MDNLEVSGPTAPPPARDPSPRRAPKQKVRKAKPAPPEAPPPDSDGDGTGTDAPGSLDVLT